MTPAACFVSISQSGTIAPQDPTSGQRLHEYPAYHKLFTSSATRCAATTLRHEGGLAPGSIVSEIIKLIGPRQ